MTDQFMLEVRWDDRAIHLPEMVGPFEAYEEAERWGELNVPNGTWTVRILSYPYARHPVTERGPNQ